jgi:ABC-type dipeptide/oligopeptide/nickel transport system permease subunit
MSYGPVAVLAVLVGVVVAVFAGAVISLAVFGFNMLGDALRDVLDPRLRGGSSPAGR